jgi:hypothetical protein
VIDHIAFLVLADGIAHVQAEDVIDSRRKSFGMALAPEDPA